MDYRPELKGVGGWLTLLIIGLCIMSPLSGFGKLSSDFEMAEKSTPVLLTLNTWADYKQYTWWVFSLSALLSFIAGYRLWKIHSKDSVRFAIIVLWTVNLLKPLGYFFVGYATLGQQAASAATTSLISAGFGGLIMAGIWTMYLMKSRRVKNTYQSLEGAA